MTPHEAQDTVSEAFIRITQHPEVDVARVIGLAVTMVRCASIDEIRRRRREERLLQHMNDPEGYDLPEIGVCSTAAARSLLARSAKVLTEAEMRVLCLVIDGEPHSVIAERLGITVRASEVALSRARRKLRRAAWLTGASESRRRPRASLS